MLDRKWNAMKTNLRIIAVLAFVLFSLPKSSFGQKIKASNTYVHFFSEAPLENIEAENKKGVSVLDLKNKKIAFLIPVAAFKFENGLMEEHFQENYLEVEEFPNATYQGKITNLNLKKKKKGTVSSFGVIEIHGVQKNIKTKVDYEVKENTLWLTSTFKVKLEDFEIEIPTVVFKNIAEEVDVTVKFAYPLN